MYCYNINCAFVGYNERLIKIKNVQCLYRTKETDTNDCFQRAILNVGNWQENTIWYPLHGSTGNTDSTRHTHTHTHKILDFAAIGEKQIVSLIVHWSLSSQPIVTVFTGELNSKQQYFPYCVSHNYSHKSKNTNNCNLWSQTTGCNILPNIT